MATDCRNDRELANLLLPSLKKVARYIAEKIQEENKVLVQQIVYDAYKPSTYNRSGEFKEAWSVSTEENYARNNVSATFEYDPSKLTTGSINPEDSDFGQHISATSGREMTDGLAEVIYQGLAGPAFGAGPQTGAWARKRDAWNRLLKVVGKRKINDWFIAGCNMYGLNVRKHVSGILRY